jgi:hypothetical protein
MKGIYFDGRAILKPGAYAKVNADAMVPNRPGAANTIGVIGTCLGGVPRTVTDITSPEEARKQLRGGILRSVAELMYDPSADMPGASRIKYYRLNLAVRAQVNLQDSVPANVILVQAKDYGVWTNQIRIKVEAGTVSGKKVTINDVLDTENFEVGDDLGDAFTIRYVGSKFDAQLVVTKTGDNATALLLQTKATGSGDPWVTELNLDLTQTSVSTLGLLCSYIDALSDYTCVVKGDQNMPTSYIDGHAGQTIKSADFTHKANIGAIVHWINSNSQLVTASRVASAVNAPANVAYTFLAGGSEGSAPNNNDWQAALDAFTTHDVNFIFVCTEDATIHAMALAHCRVESGVSRRHERICILGGAAGETVAQEIARAQALNDQRAALIYPGIKRRNLTTGNVDSLSPMYAAALVTGIAAGSPPETPLTFKSVRVSGLEKILTLTEIEQLLDKGVMPLESVPSDGLFRIVQGITTYLKDANVIWRKVAGVRIADYLNRNIRQAVQHFVGRTADRRTMTTILNAVVTRLRSLTRTETNQVGVLTEGQSVDGLVEPAFKNVKAEFDGFDLVAVSYEAHPVGEVAYITITAGLTPTTIVASA